jgi:hypothetical protein
MVEPDAKSDVSRPIAILEKKTTDPPRLAIWLSTRRSVRRVARLVVGDLEEEFATVQRRFAGRRPRLVLVADDALPGCDRHPFAQSIGGRMGTARLDDAYSFADLRYAFRTRPGHPRSPLPSSPCCRLASAPTPRSLASVTRLRIGPTIDHFKDDRVSVLK